MEGEAGDTKARSVREARGGRGTRWRRAAVAPTTRCFVGGRLAKAARTGSGGGAKAPWVRVESCAPACLSSPGHSDNKRQAVGRRQKCGVLPWLSRKTKQRGRQRGRERRPLHVTAAASTQGHEGGASPRCEQRQRGRRSVWRRRWIPQPNPGTKKGRGREGEKDREDEGRRRVAKGNAEIIAGKQNAAALSVFLRRPHCSRRSPQCTCIARSHCCTGRAPLRCPPADPHPCPCPVVRLGLGKRTPLLLALSAAADGVAILVDSIGSLLGHGVRCVRGGARERRRARRGAWTGQGQMLRRSSV